VTSTDRKGERLVGLFILGCMLFNFPLLALFSLEGTVFGLPVIYAYLFGAWASLIGLAAFVVERGD
jgi:hypothetical protein